MKWILLCRYGGICRGFGKNLYTGNDVDTLRECGGKAALQLTPIDKLELLARLDYYHANDSSGLITMSARCTNPIWSLDAAAIDDGRQVARKLYRQRIA
jgi:hypothetical protein